jgi:uncharacterized protein involved in outer membrane biogenesis
MNASAAARTVALVKTPRARKVLWWLLGLLAAFALVGFFVVPPIAKSQLEQKLSEALHRPVTVETVRVNPFAPAVTVRGFAVRERSGDAPFVTFDELYVNAAWTSVFRLAPVIDEVKLTKPHVRVVRNADRTYNFQDLLDEALAKPKSQGPPPKFAVFNIQLLGGRIDFDDRAEKQLHEVADLRVGIPFVSNLPSHVEVKVLPELAARINGAALDLKGETLPFKDTLVATLNVDLDDFDLTRLVGYLPFELRGKVKSALLDTRLVLTFEQPDRKPPQIKVRGATAVKRVNVLDPEDRPMLAWERLGIEINEVDALPPAVDLRSITLEGLDVFVRRDKSGVINLERLGQAAAAGTDRQREARRDPGRDVVPIKVGLLALAGKVRFTDETTTPAFETALDELRLEGRDLDNAKGKRTELSLAARTDAGETVKLAAGVIAEPPSADGRVDVAGVKLKRYQPYVAQAANLEIDDGELATGAAFKWASDNAFAKHDLKVSDATLALKSLRVRLAGEKEPLVRAASVEVKSAGADLQAHVANLGVIAVRDLAASVRREKDGKLNVERIARTARPGSHEKPASAPPQATTAAPPWRIDLDALSLERGSVALEDLAVADPLRLTVAPIQLKAEKFSTAKGQRGNVNLRATIDKAGTLAASGPLSLDPLAGSLRIEARAIDFAPAQRYIDDKVDLTVTSGAISAKGAAAFELPPGGAIKASYKGDVAVTDFASVDKPTKQDLLKWKTLSLGAIDFTLEPLRIALDEFALADFYARIILSAEGRLNLHDLARAPGSAAPTGPAAAEKPAAPAPKPAAAEAAAPAAAPLATLPPNVRVGRITLQGGNVNFSDFFIKPNYTANLTGVGGAVTEMTAEKPGEVDLRAKIDNAAPVEILGRVNPLAPELFLDLKANAKDIELPPMSPYSIKYAGYGIERGKLSVNVEYHIENRKLAAKNNIHLDQLTFGEKVDSPTATKLPVTLAVALLKDRNGVIDVNLPISGSLDSPEFSVIGIIFQVIGNLVVKAVTAPFALLGAAFGGGEELAYLEFAPGSARLDGEDVGKLKNLTKALTERPGLKLDVAGRVDPEADREGLKRASIERKVKAEKFNDLRREGKAPASADAVTIEQAEYERYLRRAYGEEKFPKPRNVIGIAKDLPVPEMETLMLTHAQVTDEDLRLLANARAQSAKEWIVTDGKIPAERVFIVAPKLTPDGIKDKGKPTRADFALK